jgi:hypothetical protein
VWKVDTQVSRRRGRPPAPSRARKQLLSPDAPAPGKIFVGTIFKGEHFHVDRTARVKSGSAKGVWHHGKRIATNSKNGKTYVVTGWVPASAFCA